MSTQDLATLETALAEAKKAHKANKSDKALKKAYKAAKKALADGQAAAAAAAAKAKKKSKKKRKRDEEPNKPAKKAKTSIEELKEALATAKSAHKANKSDAGLKKAYKAAKKALAAAEAEQTEATPMEVEESKEEAQDEAPEAEEESKEESKEVDLASLNKAKNNKAGNNKGKAGNYEFPPNPKLFCRNLSFTIDEAAITEFFAAHGKLQDIHWLTDKESGEFIGRGFVTLESTEQATKALEELDGQECAGRNVYLSYAKPRAMRSRGGNSEKAKRFIDAPLSERPENCTTCFVGNVSFNITDEDLIQFAESCGEIKSIRWMSDRETGQFKGYGFVEFNTPEETDEFVKLRGQELLGRPVRIDYSAGRKNN